MSASQTVVAVEEAATSGAAVVSTVAAIGASPLAPLIDRRRGAAPRGSHRALALSETLGSPHLHVPAIHVAGTNGKTSVVRLVVALLGALDVRSGDTTSPHLHHLDERIRIDGQPLGADRLAAACRGLSGALAVAERRVGEAPTFFDAVTVVALRTFVDAGVGFAVVEAGIGGAGDATNIVQGRVAVLTPVGLDHGVLGATHAEIAEEKAGIVEPGGVVVMATQVPAAAQVVERVAARQGARLLRAGIDLGVARRLPDPEGQQVWLRGLDGSRLRAHLPLHGAPQASNAALALATVQAALGTTDLDPQRLRAGFSSVQIPGRTEVVQRRGEPTVILDGAHDPPAMAALVATLREDGPGQRLPPPASPSPRAVATAEPVVVFGMSGDRDPLAVLAPLRQVASHVVVVATGGPSAHPAPALADRLRGDGYDVSVATNVGHAIDLASHRAGPGGLMVVTGSLYLVAEARTALGMGRRIRAIRRRAGASVDTGRVAG